MDRDGPSTAVCLRDSDPFNVVIGVIIANVTVTVTAIVGGGGGSGGGSGSSIHHHPQQLQSAIVSTAWVLNVIHDVAYPAQCVYPHLQVLCPSEQFLRPINGPRPRHRVAPPG